MNLFILPSWYPNNTQALSGIFTQEQAQAIAALCPDIRVIVSTWGHDDGEVTMRNPWRAFKALNWRLQQKKNQVCQQQGVWEVFNPTLTWSLRLPLGGVDRLVRVNRRNLQLAIDRFGKIGLIHAHVSYPAGYIASILGPEFGIPYVLTEHMSPFPLPSLMKHGRPMHGVEQAFANASESIAVSPSLAKCIATFGYRGPVVIPNVVDETLFFPGEPSKEKFVFFTLCSLSAQKGVDHLLEAIAKWDPPADRFEFRIGGDGILAAAYQAMANHLGIADRVRWLGSISREDASRQFQQCHIYVMPSRHETFGVVYAEAIASGKPIIATRCGGPESIVNSANGCLVEIGDIAGLSDTMQQLSAEWTQFDPLAIRQDFENRFSRPAVVAQLRLIYQSVMRA